MGTEQKEKMSVIKKNDNTKENTLSNIIIIEKQETTFPGSLFHVPSPSRGIFRPVLRTAKSFMPLRITLKKDEESMIESVKSCSASLDT